MTAMPNPSGFRSLTLPDNAPAAMLCARMVRGKIDFNYSFDGEHQIVYPVKHDREIVRLLREIRE